MNNENHILLISYYFPPEINGGAARAFANYHYLNKLGNRVTVLTTDRASSIDCVADVYRVKCWRNAGIIGLTKRILGYLLTKFGFYYGEDIYWCDEVVKAIKLLPEKIDIVYVSYPGADALIIGMAAAKILNAKLVTEFRDGFYFEPHVHMIKLQRWGAKKLEKKITIASEKIVCASKTITEYFQDTYKQVSAYTVYNGYSELDFIAYEPVINVIDAPVTIVHLGRLAGSGYRNIKPLVDALNSLYENGVIKRNDFELLFLGALTYQELGQLSNLLLSGVVKYRPSVTKEQAVRIVTEYQYLLFYGVPDHKSVVSSKLLEYLRMGKPVLGICKGNEAAEIIETTGVGEVVDFQIEEIKCIFTKAINGVLNYFPNSEQINFYNRETQVKKLSLIIEEKV